MRVVEGWNGLRCLILPNSDKADSHACSNSIDIIGPLTQPPVWYPDGNLHTKSEVRALISGVIRGPRPGQAASAAFRTISSSPRTRQSGKQQGPRLELAGHLGSSIPRVETVC